MVDRTTPKYQAISAKAQNVSRSKRREWLFEYKKTLSCVYCGNNNPLNLDLDHIDRNKKTDTPARMLTNGTAWDKVMKELENCQPVCRNCHNIKSILESGKMKGCDIEPFIPEAMRHLRANGVTE
jgi:5-methylcytosine-specific restriction endonuclease McrA